MACMAYFDGACSGNPGSMSIGYVVRHMSGETKEYSIDIGKGTNNDAEYRALIELLEYLEFIGITRAWIYGDSKLVINQVNKLWKVKHEDLEDMAREAWAYMDDHPGWKLDWIPREQNPADAVVKGILEKGVTK